MAWTGGLAEPAHTTGLDLLSPARSVLEHVVAYFAVAGIDLPPRRYLTPGTPALIAWDCEQVVVACALVQHGKSASGTQSSPQLGAAAATEQMRTAALTVQIVRCVPTLRNDGSPPSADEIEAAGEQALTDMGTLSQALVELAAQPGLVAPRGTNITAGAVEPFGPEGGLAGCTGSVSLSIGGLLP